MKPSREEAFAMDKGGSPTEAFFKVNDRQFIELYPGRDASQSVGFMHICFEAADINALCQDYVAHGLAPTPVKRAGAGNRLFTLQRPDQPGLPRTCAEHQPRTLSTPNTCPALATRSISDSISALIASPTTSPESAFPWPILPQRPLSTSISSPLREPRIRSNPDSNRELPR